MIADFDWDRPRFDAEASFFQKVDRILSGLPKLSVQNLMFQGVACCDTRHQVINMCFSEIERNSKDDVDFIALCKGLNYHELAHILFTKDVPSHNLNKVEACVRNVLEDGRIESLFGLRYPNAQPYFEHAVNRLILENASNLTPENFVLVEARQSFINENIRKNFELVFEATYGIEKTKMVKELIKKYLSAKTISEQYTVARLVAEILGKVPMNFSMPSENTSVLSDQLEDEEIDELSVQISQTKQGGTPNPELMKQLQKNRELMAKLNKAVEKYKREQVKISDRESALATQQSGIEKKLLKNRADANALMKEPNLTDKQKLDKAKPLASEYEKITQEKKKLEEAKDKLRWEIIKNTQKHNKFADDLKEQMKLTALSDMAKEQTEQAMRTLSKEIHKDMNAIYSSNNFSNDTNTTSNAVPLTVTQEHKLMSSQINQVIRKIKCELRRGHITNLKSGRVNVQKAMSWKKTGNIRMFKKFLPNKVNETKLGVVFLLDASGSMSNESFETAMQSAWVVSDALTKLGNKTLIMQFDTYFQLIKGFDDKIGDFSRKLQGGTNPVNAIEYARQKMLFVSQRDKIKNWIFFILTDGQFSDASDQMIEQMNKSKVETVMVFFGEDAHLTDCKKHRCKHWMVINDIRKLVDVFRGVAEKVEKNITDRLRRSQ